eukprot:CAMPEP_0198579744 /NCGR_PEP_ID=MMETSP1462-20131121/121941_1 /TAXON_ID=1333877 /ORGANISM="Brandtodinium nutriculum, Strain RCC3387" /LENGTH=47 /DNA_ID= /DNA_START= /DNA_END= /DNA_ORIENTATION=
MDAMESEAAKLTRWPAPANAADSTTDACRKPKSRTLREEASSAVPVS